MSRLVDVNYRDRVSFARVACDWEYAAVNRGSSICQIGSIGSICSRCCQPARSHSRVTLRHETLALEFSRPIIDSMLHPAFPSFNLHPRISRQDSCKTTRNRTIFEIYIQSTVLVMFHLRLIKLVIITLQLWSYSTLLFRQQLDVFLSRSASCPEIVIETDRRRVCTYFKRIFNQNPHKRCILRIF